MNNQTNSKKHLVDLGPFIKIANANRQNIATVRPDLVKETWVKVGVIKALTGWNQSELRRARDNNLVKMKRKNQKIFYLLESLHPDFIIYKISL